MLAERYFSHDPNTCLLKLPLLSEVLAQRVASNVGILDRPEDGQYELLSRLRDHGILPYKIHQLFGKVRRTGNSANHALAGDHRTALAMLKIVWQTGTWFHRTFRDKQTFWENLASEAGSEKASLQQRHTAKQEAAATHFHLDEAET